MCKENKFRSRTIALLLYPDDLTHVKAMDMIKANYDYVAILHDKDTKLVEVDYVPLEGEVFTGNIIDQDTGVSSLFEVVKKAHWHVILRFKNAMWNSAVCKELGIEMNYSEQIRNFDNSMMYLIHYNDSDKYQYNIKEVFGTFKNRLTDIINNQNKSEGEKVSELIGYIEEQERYLSTKDFAKWCALNGYWSEFRRSGAIFCRILDEHNKQFI